MTQVLQFRGRRNDWTAVEKFLAARHAPSTKLMYRSSVRKFEGWCSERGLSSLPAEPNTLAMFLAAEGEAGRAPSTILPDTPPLYVPSTPIGAIRTRLRTRSSPP